MSEEILQLNHLDYCTPEVLNVSKKTTRIQHQLYCDTYTDLKGDEVIQVLFDKIPDCCYIDGSKSSIKLKINVNVPVPTTADEMTYWACDKNSSSFANTGSTILNFFKSVVHQTDNNQILYRENYINLMQCIREYHQSYERKKVLTEVGGYIQGAEEYYNIFSVNKSISFNLPLYLIAPFWNTASMIPSKILKNSKLSLVVNNIIQSIYPLKRDGLNAAPFPAEISVTFSDMSLNLYQTELYDKLHNQITKEDILEFPYHCYNNNIHTLNNSSFIINIPLQAQKVSYVALKFRRNTDSPTASASIAELGNPKSIDNNYLPIKIQARINGMIFPQYPINDSVNAYIESINAIQGISYPNAQNVDPLKMENKLLGTTISYRQFSSTDVKQDPQDSIYKFVSGLSSGGVIFAIDLQKSNNVSLSGLEVNASRNLVVEIDGLDNYENLYLYSQVKYMSVATINNGNIIVSK
jgi:hypothetical protein